MCVMFVSLFVVYVAMQSVARTIKCWRVECSDDKELERNSEMINGLEKMWKEAVMTQLWSSVPRIPYRCTCTHVHWHTEVHTHVFWHASFKTIFVTFLNKIIIFHHLLITDNHYSWCGIGPTFHQWFVSVELLYCILIISVNTALTEP